MDNITEEITPRPGTSHSASIEATGYTTLALIEHGDAFNVSRAAKWLVSQRNAYGGYGSTQDTMIALEALTRYSAGAQSHVDLHVNISAGSEEQELRINSENFDVLQTVEVSAAIEFTPPEPMEAEMKAKGVSSEVYSYYNRAMSGETLGQDMTVVE